jgi:hypothetical protein
MFWLVPVSWNLIWWPDSVLCSAVLYSFWLIQANLMKILNSTCWTWPPIKQSCWYRYVDGTFVVWPHGAMNYISSINTVVTYIWTSSSQWKYKQMDHYHFWMSWRPENQITHWGIQYAENPPVAASLSYKVTLSSITKTCSFVYTH